MRTHEPWPRRRWFAVTTALLFALLLAGAGAAFAGSPGQLKLRVARCSNGAWIANAAVSVQIYHASGGGPGDVGSGTTDGNGYVTISFTSLEDDDEAHVTVTPSGENADPSHIYQWLDPEDRDAGGWDLGLMLDQTCTDDWYDQTNNIILCRYNS